MNRGRMVDHVDRTGFVTGGWRSRVVVVGLAAVWTVFVLGTLTTGSGALPHDIDGDAVRQVGVTANVSVSPNPAPPGETVLLDARESSGGDSAIESCAFDVDGDGAYDVETQDCVTEWTYEAAGEYAVAVRVRTTANETATETTTLTVSENRPPTAVIGVTPAEPTAGETVTLTAADSHDPDGRIVETSWRMPERTLQGETVQVSFPSAGEYEVSLVVADDDGLEGAATQTITVVANRPPTVSLSVTSEDIRVGETVTLDASDASDPDGTVVEFRWDLDGDGTIDRTTEDPQTTVTVDEPGTRSVSVTAVDDADGTATGAVEFDVRPATTPTTTTPTTTPAATQGGGPLAAVDVGIVPYVPDWVTLFGALLAVVGLGTAWRRRTAIQNRVEDVRERLARGDVRRRIAKTASGTVTKTAAKRIVRALADGIDVGGRRVGETIERLGRAIKRWSGRAAAFLRRLAGYGSG